MAAATSLQPDMVMWCLPAKTVMMAELTVPWEERMEEALERKKGEVWRACCNMHGSGMGDTHLPCGSRTQRLCWKIHPTPVEDPVSHRIRAKEGSQRPETQSLSVRQGSRHVPENVLSHDDCKEATSLMKHSADQDVIKRKMRKTFVMVLDPPRSINILSEGPGNQHDFTTV